MKVLFLTSSSIWVHNLPAGFREAGHEVMVSGPLTEYNIPQMISSFRPDLIVTMGWGYDQEYCNQTWIQRITSSANIPDIYWSMEDPCFTEVFTIPLLHTLKPDFVFTNCEAAINSFKTMGFNSAHMDFAFQPDIHKPVEKNPIFECSIAVVANAYPNVFSAHPGHYRIKSLQTLISPLVKAGIRVDFWGRDWDKVTPHLGCSIPSHWCHGFLPYLDANKVYSSADIILGLQNYEDQLTQRTYEVLGSGGLLLTSDTPAVRSMFKPGYDLLVSAAPEETVRLVDYYFNAPDLRRKIKKHGRRAVSNHTYKNRAEYIVGILKQNGILPKELY